MTSLYDEGFVQPEIIYYDNIVPTKNNEIDVLKKRLALLQSSVYLHLPNLISVSLKL